MTNQSVNPQGTPPQPAPGLLRDVISEIRLTWRLLRDPRIPVWLKLIPATSVLYVVFPFDFLTDFVPVLGQLDDLAALILGFRTFVSMSPPAIVEEHRRAIAGGTAAPSAGAPVIDGTYQQVPPQKDPWGNP